MTVQGRGAGEYQLTDSTVDGSPKNDLCSVYIYPVEIIISAYAHMWGVQCRRVNHSRCAAESFDQKLVVVEFTQVRGC